MRPLVLLWGCLLLPGYEALMGPKKIRGFEGDTVSLQCTYEEKLREHKKYWCKKGGILVSRCSGIIYAREDGEERTEGRVSIQDDPQKLTLTVTLRELTLQDSGDYWCGVNILGIDETFLVSLLVLPGPCCPPSPTPSFQPLATSLQPKAKAWQTQPPASTSPGAHPTVTKQGKTEAEASPFTGTSPPEPAGTSLYTGTSPYAGNTPNEERPLHRATSPHAGTSRPSTYLDSTSTEDPTSRASHSKAHILVPVLVLLVLLLAAGLAVVGRCVLRCRKEVQLDPKTQNEKVHLSHLNRLGPEYAVVNLAAPPGPRAGPKPSASPYTEIPEIRRPSQALKEEEASFQDPAGAAKPGPPLHMSEEELRSSVFIPV
ncbi:LOW QUALITY PROTEIN: CMRF35-like molecule 9 [Myotis lucifugus]|uniref:LOW QUALITY PROTEIN: CMRF35-like molecule 9 n=1 Tax=Myotis lucifugus TaxID=59463 RepID=UPI000CCC01D8|nr:LOW QUALITY PROTEIN: CMRF35-like molecule 9 [Myotis lucifugus]